MATATITVELDLTVSGRYDPGQPDRLPNASDDVGELGWDAFVEDVEVINLTCDRPVFDIKTGRRVWTTHQLLTGVDVTQPDVQRLLANLLELVRDDAEQALLENAE